MAKTEVKKELEVLVHMNVIREDQTEKVEELMKWLGESDAGRTIRTCIDMEHFRLIGQYKG